MLLIAQHLFFFSSRRRHTRSYGDWSSDVCSSDLRIIYSSSIAVHDRRGTSKGRPITESSPFCARTEYGEKIGRASCRERVENVGGAGGGKKKRKEMKIREVEI